MRNAQMFALGLVFAVLGIVPALPKGSTDVISGWFILYTYPLVLGGVGLMVFAALRAIFALFAIDRRMVNVLAGVLMMAQYLIVRVLEPGFVIGSLSFGVAFVGLATCLITIVMVLRALSTEAPRAN